MTTANGEPMPTDLHRLQSGERWGGDNAEVLRQFDRAARLIEKMAGYIGKMALDANDLADLNEHWLFVEKRARAILKAKETEDVSPTEGDLT